jgi:hypothetical protein
MKIFSYAQNCRGYPKYDLAGGARQFSARSTEKLCSRPQDTFQVFAYHRQFNIPLMCFTKFSLFPSRIPAIISYASLSHAGSGQTIFSSETHAN